MRLLLATRNRGKIREFEAALADLDVSFLTLDQTPDLPEPDETGPTFQANARLKALYYQSRTGLPSLSDDSGLVVNALGGAPGVLSARYGPTDAARLERLLMELGGVPEAERGARFICSLCVCWNKDRFLEAEGAVEGVILTEPRGANGFGYDPVFYYPPLNKTFGELETAQKNRVSHRSRALAQLRRRLQNLETPGISRPR